MRPGPGSVETLANGIIFAKNEPDFTAVAAVDQHGTYHIVSGYRYNSAIVKTANRYAAEGLFPAPLESENVRPVTPEDLQRLYGAARHAAEQEAMQSGSASAMAKLSKALSDSARVRASDLKIISDTARTKVRVKVAGREFSASSVWTPAEGDTAMAAIFDSRDQGSGDATASHNAFQSFSVSPGSALRMPDGVVKLRGQKGWHEMDVGTGGHMVLRLFYSDAAQQATASLDQLGFDEETMAALAAARAKLSGGVIIAGATGDGKSTTLVRCLQQLYREHDERISIVTIEDPVEYRIRGDGIIQIPVKSAGSAEERTAAFRKALMHFVRINPDVGAISEVRDADAAREVLQFIDTGHQVWTTIHGSSANGILFRLIEMEIPPEELCKPGSIELLMKQSLAPMLCASCALPLSAAREERAARAREVLSPLEAETGKVFLRNPEGCPRCRPDTEDPVAMQAWAGYMRQVAVGEVILPDEGYFDRVRERDAFGALAHWLKPQSEGGLGGTPLGAKLAGMALGGDLDPLDAVRMGIDFRKVAPGLVPGRRPLRPAAAVHRLPAGQAAG